MTGKRRDRSRSWQPFVRVTPSPSSKTLDTTSLSVAREVRKTLRKEMWENNLYTVIVTRTDEGHVEVLSIRRNDRGHLRDWRHLQRIKNVLAGPDCEAVELFPAEDRLVDAANQTWLWVFPPGMRVPLGFTERLVQDAGEGIDTGHVQRAFE